MPEGDTPEGVKILVNPPPEKVNELAQFLRWFPGSFYEFTPRGHLIVIDTEHLHRQLAALVQSEDIQSHEFSLSSAESLSSMVIRRQTEALRTQAVSLCALPVMEFARWVKKSHLKHELDHKNQQRELRAVGDLSDKESKALGLVLQQQSIEQCWPLYRAYGRFEVFAEARAISEEMQAQIKDDHYIMLVYRLGSLLQMFRVLPADSWGPPRTNMENLLAYQTGNYTSLNNYYQGDTALLMLLTGQTNLFDLSANEALSHATDLGEQVLGQIALFLQNPDAFIINVTREELRQSLNESLKRQKEEFIQSARALLQVVFSSAAV